MRRFDALSAQRHCHAGLTLPELLLAVLLLGLMAVSAVAGTGRLVARTRVEAAARQLALGLEQARTGAERSGQPCALELGSRGWVAPSEDEAVSTLPSCAVTERMLEPAVDVVHNLTGPLRISSNGLVLDGGTVVVAAAGTDLKRCLVVSLPLGVVRLGRSTAQSGAVPRSTDCVVDSLL